MKPLFTLLLVSLTLLSNAQNRCGAEAYTKELKEKYPENNYSIIMGSDNLQNFHKWKNYEQILEDYSVYVYPRPGYEISGSHKNIHIIEGVPQMEISSSFIRQSIKE